MITCHVSLFVVRHGHIFHVTPKGVLETELMRSLFRHNVPTSTTTGSTFGLSSEVPTVTSSPYVRNVSQTGLPTSIFATTGTSFKTETLVVGGLR